MTDTALATIPQPAGPHGFALAPAEMGARVKALDAFFKSVMQQGTDYGIIPGTPKPTLFQPGAQLLDGLFGLAPEFRTEPTSIRDYAEGFFSLDVTCSLRSKATGQIVAEGVGNANSREPRYSKQNVYALLNTLVKMAAKRAHVAATLNATGAARIFTQDIEDMDLAPEPPAQQQRRDAPKAGPPQATPEKIEEAKRLMADLKAIGNEDKPASRSAVDVDQFLVRGRQYLRAHPPIDDRLTNDEIPDAPAPDEPADEASDEDLSPEMAHLWNQVANVADKLASAKIEHEYPLSTSTESQLNDWIALNSRRLNARPTARAPRT